MTAPTSSKDSKPTPAPSTRGGAVALGKYELIANLGHGGMADVFLAMARGPVGFNKLQVIKRLRPNLAEEQEFLEMFLDEARLAARLNHPNVVQTNEVGEVAGNYFIAMEYLDGQPLNRVVRESRKQPEQEVGREIMLAILCEALSGLHYAHNLSDYSGADLGVVHRDASPHNIFVTYDGQVKVVDFGIAKAATRTAETRTGVLKGKIAYMSPEQAAGTDVDHLADQFSMGMVMWELLAGKRAWKGLSDIKIIDRLLSTKPVPSIGDEVEDLPEELVKICDKACALKPQDRFENCEAMREALLKFLGNDRPSRDAVGKSIVALFEDRRQRMQKMIDEQIATLEENGIGLGEVSSRSMSLPSLATATLSDTLEGTPSSAAVRSLAATADSTAASIAPPKSGSKVWLGIIAALAIGGAFAYVSMSKEQPAPTPAVSVKPGEPSIRLKLKLTPASAKVFVDDTLIGEGISSKELRKDKGEHILRFEAEGYVSTTRTVVFDSDVDLVVALNEVPPPPAPEPTASASADEEDAAPVAARPRPVRQAQPAAAAEEPKPAAKPNGGGMQLGTPDKRTLDKNDPWAD